MSFRCDPTPPDPEMMRYGRGQNTASNTVPLPRESTWGVVKWRAKGFMKEIPFLFCRQKRKSPTSHLSSCTGLPTIAKRSRENLPPVDSTEHGISAARSSHTVSASFGCVISAGPSHHRTTGISAEDVAGSESMDRVSPLISEPPPWVGTMRIHLNNGQPNATALCRCLLDTGSDLNLVSLRILRTLSLQFIEHQGPKVRTASGTHFLPIGVVVLTWHMDKREQVDYHAEFSVVPDDPPALFDVILGKHWINKYKALQRNSSVMIARSLGFHPLSPSTGDSVGSLFEDDISA